MEIQQLDHFVLTVRDVEATCEFYRRVLAMEVVTFGAGRRALRFGDQKINLHQAGREFDPKADRPTPGSADLCFLSDTPLAVWMKHLHGTGVPIEEGPVPRTGARGPIESIYLRDPDGNLLEIGVTVTGAARSDSTVGGLTQVRPGSVDPSSIEFSRITEWLREWEARVRAVDFEGGRKLCAPELLAFGTRAEIADGLDAVVEHQWRRVWPMIRDFTVRIAEARGAIVGDSAWVAAPWDSLGTHDDGATYRRPGRLTVAFERRQGRWLAVHTHFSLSPPGTPARG